MKRLLLRLRCYFSRHPIAAERLNEEHRDGERVIWTNCLRCGKRLEAPYGIALIHEGAEFVQRPLD